MWNQDTNCCGSKPKMVTLKFEQYVDDHPRTIDYDGGKGIEKGNVVSNGGSRVAIGGLASSVTTDCLC